MEHALYFFLLGRCVESVFQSLMKGRVLDQILISTRCERSTPKLSASVVIKNEVCELVTSRAKREPNIVRQSPMNIILSCHPSRMMFQTRMETNQVGS